jgi:hypothetical protein
MDRPDDLTLVRLVLARQRRQGASFGEAWPVALGVLPPIDEKGREAEQRSTTLAALEHTREAWQAGYERKPPPPPRFSEAAARSCLRERLAAVAA